MDDAREPRTSVVLLMFTDDRKEFVPDTHIHGLRDGQLQLATGDPGSGLSADVVRTIPVVDLKFAETCSKSDEPDGD